MYKVRRWLGTLEWMRPAHSIMRLCEGSNGVRLSAAASSGVS